MEQATRNKLRNVVTQCRRLLEDAVSQELQGRLGIHAHPKKDEVVIEEEVRMTNLSDEDRAHRKDLIDHFEHIRASGAKPKDALAQLVREIAFTHLNRLCAYKMMEAREVYVGGHKFREADSRGVNSNGVKFYLAEHPEDERLFNTGRQDLAYRHFLDWLGGLLSEEIGVLFSPNDPANRLYPPQRVLDDVLALINDAELADIWSQDETIGWVYQYFTPKELRDQARKESEAPRNSYELAFRNQFFTPRYVVEFLTDNTLGRTWYEMRKGDTMLKDQCRYLVRRPNEIFLANGNASPPDAALNLNALSQEELLKQPVYVPHRPKQDPRELKILDPACGSGHFLLYCFELLLTIYEEAWHDPELGPSLQRDFASLDDLRNAAPRLILANNLHGIDIDLRCTQIAALALWLRCQRAYQSLSIGKARPTITRSNIVCAEPMPGEQAMLTEFVAGLEPKLLGQLVEVVFEKMRLAGEAGSLLKIEEEIRGAVAAAKRQWQTGPLPVQRSLFEPDTLPARQQRFDLSGITDNQFFEQAESRIVEALRTFSQVAQNGSQMQRRLFSDDALRGFGFVDLCRKRFDVVLMNPPFGEASPSSFSYLEKTYSTWNKNILCCFVDRMRRLLADGGCLGAILDKTCMVKSTYEMFRTECLLASPSICAAVDLGWSVLDSAQVEVALGSWTRQATTPVVLLGKFADVPLEEKAPLIAKSIGDISAGIPHQRVSIRGIDIIRHFPNSAVPFDIKDWIVDVVRRSESFETCVGKAMVGCQIKADVNFRLFWELPLYERIGTGETWTTLFNGGEFSPYYAASRDVVRFGKAGNAVPYHKSNHLTNLHSQQTAGFGWGKRGDYVDAQIMPEGSVFTIEGQALPFASRKFWPLGLLNARLFWFLMNLFCGQHKYAGYVNVCPVPRPSGMVKDSLEHHCERACAAARMCFVADETCREFVCASGVVAGKSMRQSVQDLFDESERRVADIVQCDSQINTIVNEWYGLSKDAQEDVNTFARSVSIPDAFRGPFRDQQTALLEVARRVLSYAIGCSLGRWDIRIAMGRIEAPALGGPFEELPTYSPGTLRGSDGRPATEAPREYPLHVVWDGILVDDAGHSDDLVQQARAVLEAVWKGAAERIEKEACEVLGQQALRDYFRASGGGGFWDDHIARYSKSRRKAPIYWLLQSSKRNYALWLYYHRLDKDMLFKALVNYVEPKIRLENSRLTSLRNEKVTAGDSGKAARTLDREIEKQEDLLSELRDFEDKLRRAADLHLEPDLNDGVVLNIAPLHELVPWKIAKDYWDELLEGKYEWSSIGKQLRQKGLVK